MPIEHQERRHSELPSIQIVKALERITATGQRPSAIFDDWLELVEATLDMLPAHLKCAVQTGHLAQDSPEAAQVWDKVRSRYPGQDWVFDKFAEGFGHLLNDASLPDGTPTYQDIVGDVYMEWGRPSRSTGQFFTPWNVARFMAEMVSDHGQEVHAHLKAAIDQSPLAQACLLAGLALEGEEAGQWFIGKVVPSALEHYQPVTVLDPCVGSGILLLAHASTLPVWMVQMGLVQYYGCDIDPTCVRMARVNCKLYGLNGSHLQYALELSAEELAALPQRYAEAYAQAQEAQDSGDSETVAQIAADLHAETYRQTSMFPEE